MITALVNRFLHWFIVGVGATVMVLLMLSKGGSVETVGLVAAIFSGFVILFEFPSGVLSDLVGQKNGGYFLVSLTGVGAMAIVLRKKRPSPGMMVLLRIIIGLLIVVLAFQKNVPTFASVYLSLFMFNGMLTIPEGTLINTLIPDDKRSSRLSLSSLAMQVGGVSGSVLYSVLLHPASSCSDTWIYQVSG